MFGIGIKFLLWWKGVVNFGLNVVVCYYMNDSIDDGIFSFKIGFYLLFMFKYF